MHRLPSDNILLLVHILLQISRPSFVQLKRIGIRCLKTAWLTSFKAFHDVWGAVLALHDGHNPYKHVSPD